MAEQDAYELAVVLDRTSCTHVGVSQRSAGAQWPCSTCTARAVLAAGWRPAGMVRAEVAEEIARYLEAATWQKWGPKAAGIARGRAGVRGEGG